MKSLTELRQLYASKLAKHKGKKKKNKFNAKKTKVAGRTFDSGAESRCYLMHKQWEKEGKIKDLRCQVTIKLSEAEIYWRADFAYRNLEGEIEVAEYKGVETNEWLLKKNLYKVYGPYKLTIYYSKGSPEVIFPSKPMNMFHLD